MSKKELKVSVGDEMMAKVKVVDIGTKGPLCCCLVTLGKGDPTEVYADELIPVHKFQPGDPVKVKDHAVWHSGRSYIGPRPDGKHTAWNILSGGSETWLHCRRPQPEDMPEQISEDMFKLLSDRVELDRANLRNDAKFVGKVIEIAARLNDKKEVT